MELWYKSPAPDSDFGWEHYGLPLGNGYLGAVVFGGIEKELSKLPKTVCAIRFEPD